MDVLVKLNNETFNVKNSEFSLHSEPSYETLELRPELGILERELGLITDIFNIYKNKFKLRYIDLGTTHGGYIPIKLARVVEHVEILCSTSHYDNISKNIKIHNINSSITITDKLIRVGDNEFTVIRMGTGYGTTESVNEFHVVISYHTLDLPNHTKFLLSENTVHIYIKNNIKKYFEEEFRYYIHGNVINYDNLINLCIMVKNAGDTFRDVLTKNLPYIDRWTILDTGSTDNTIDIIKEVLKNKKGNLYQENFINFRDSRNRCLELAGKSCKYTIMLDDTYILKGNVRKFLNLIRSDQFSDSYNVFVNSGDNIYGSNRILKSEKDLKYIFLIHEIVQSDNNKTVQLPLDQIYIDDISNDYMLKRSLSRKQYDLEMLFKTLKEYPEVPRTLYYLARTYSDLRDWDNCYKYAEMRATSPYKGYNEEVTESYLICGNVAESMFKWPWKKCEELYLKCFENDQTRADALYCIGMHHYGGGSKPLSYEYLKKGFLLGVPKFSTSNLRLNIYNKFIPQNLAHLCYELKDYQLGEQASIRYLENNPVDETILSYLKIFKLLNKSKPSIKQKHLDKKILCFVADGGFKPWDGNSIYKEGVGGSETYIIEMAAGISNITNYIVYVFCNTNTEKKIGNVIYININNYISFINEYKVDLAIISRYSEYIPVSLENNVGSIYFVLHDLKASGNIIPLDVRLKKIFCLSEWHKNYFLNEFPSMKDRIDIFPNGINLNSFSNKIIKIKNSFIYSSFPNRGLLQLLRMFPEIRRRVPNSTLNIFCDLNNGYVLSVAKKEIEEIIVLLSQQKDYVTNHGFQSKNELYEHMLRSEIWLYPCTFKETFCVTALEMAAAGVLAITTDLAALKETVGDRGIMISGDPNSKEWVDTVIGRLVEISNDTKLGLVKKNREWAALHNWTTLTHRFVKSYIHDEKIKIKNYAPIQENIEYLCNRFSFCKKVLEIGPGIIPFPLATHFVDHIDHGVKGSVTMDITIDKLPFGDNEFDLVYCRHVLEDIHNPEFVIKELSRVAKIVYIETPSPLAETSRHIDGSSPYYRGYIHHRYMIYNKEDTLYFLPKFPIIEYIKIEDNSEKLADKYYWNTYFIWNKDNGDIKFKVLQYDKDYNLHTDYEKVVHNAVNESIKSINKYKNMVKFTNVELDYEGMLNWSSDIPIGSKSIFLSVLDTLKNKNPKILEIGTYSGTSIISMLKYLTDAKATVIDMWKDYTESELSKNMESGRIEEIFKRNCIISNCVDRIKVIKGDSKDILMELIMDGGKYDFIYVDGSHMCLDCYSDIIMSWELLKPGGILAIDDYLWNTQTDNDKLNLPYYAVQHFTERYKGKYTILNVSYRVFLLKL